MQWFTQWLLPSSLKKAPTVYERIGGRKVVTAIAHSFYDIMENDTYAAPLLDMHPKPLDKIRQLFTDYLTMWMGGPDNYTPVRGHPKLRARHLPYKITPALKAQWMYCMRKAVCKHVEDGDLSQHLLSQFNDLAQHMVNAED